MTIWDRIGSQITSGRWLLTQAAALCMILLTLTDCYVAIKHPDAKLPVSIDGIVAIVTMVFISYFRAKEDTPVGGTPVGGFKA